MTALESFLAGLVLAGFLIALAISEPSPAEVAAAQRHNSAIRLPNYFPAEFPPVVYAP